MTARVFLDGRLSQISENADQSFCEPMALTLMYSTVRHRLVGNVHAVDLTALTGNGNVRP